MATALELDPVFVHASPRSGSTYFFSVLRRNESLVCFNEAIMDGKRDYERFKKPREREIFRAEAQKWNVNHHFLGRDEFAEFIDAWDEVMHLCPEFPAFHDYLPLNGVLSADLRAYLSALIKYAQARHKRPVLCEINSRGRAGAMRGAFGGFHIAQYRNPLSQFGSFIRGLIDGGAWGFLVTPLTELAASRAHPLYQLVPEIWRAPSLPWRTKTRAQFWASGARYTAEAASPRPEGIENLFRWHMFSWTLGNLAAISYSDMALDIDKVHDDADYRASVVSDLAREFGGAPDFSDIKKFDRYYDFELFDVDTVCSQVVSTIRSALADGSLDAAIQTLGTQPPLVPAAKAVDLLGAKIQDSQASMASSTRRHHMNSAEWKALTAKNRRVLVQPGRPMVCTTHLPCSGTGCTGSSASGNTGIELPMQFSRPGSPVKFYRAQRSFRRR